MKKYHIKSTILYAIGRAIETEDDPEVREQLEDLEEKITVAYRRVEDKKIMRILEA